MEYLDCRAPFCPKYKSDVRYPAIAVGYYLMFLEDARVWGTLGVGRGKLEFQDEAESVSAHSETVTLYRLSVKGAYRVLTPIVTIPLIFGVEYIVNPIKNFFYNGVEIEGGRVQGDPHYLIGVGAEF